MKRAVGGVLALTLAAVLGTQASLAQGLPAEPQQPEASITYQTTASPAADSAALPASLPDVALRMADGSVLHLSDLRGQTILLHFWAAWCPPCRREVPSLNRLAIDLKGRGVTVIGVSVDADTAAVRTFIRGYGVRYPIAIGGGELSRALGGVYGLPTSFIVTPDGAVARRVVGATTGRRLQSLLLQSTAPGAHAR
ncbi:MAG TPA: TlpA disulfide reductase family protein [Rhodothermales bacterium]|nr:TlpA disulfide reductase family protein [Rhodothermales bacterium]